VKVSREYVEDILARTGLSPEDKARIRAVSYPADRDELLHLFESMGIRPDELTSHMGGSP
jgi:hypothetical protein